jgi:antitoxin protein of toxin-antitoxin system
MGINFDDLKNKAQDLVKEHGDKIEDGVEKAGEFAKNKFGHAEQVDKVVDKIQDAIPDRPAQGGGGEPRAK